MPGGVQVIPEGTAPQGAGEAAPVRSGPQSPLDLLRGKRTEINAALFTDLAVPRRADQVGKSIWVRYGPADPTLFANALANREQAHLKLKRDGSSGDPAWSVKAHSDLLVASCLGVYFLEPDEQPPTGDLPAGMPTFSTPELSEALDAPANAVATVGKLYATELDLLNAATQLLEWSGQASERSDKDFLGR